MVVLPTTLGFLSGAVVIPALERHRMEAIKGRLFVGDVGLVVGFIIGLLIKLISPRPVSAAPPV